MLSIARLAKLIASPALMQLETHISNTSASHLHQLETQISSLLASQRHQLESLLVLQGRALAQLNNTNAPLAKLQDAEFKVFSQFGEDGILQYLIQETAISRAEASFIEFGVEDYSESNTRFLLLNNQWRGMIIDGSKAHMDLVRSQSMYWRYDLTAIDAWIDRDNINQLIADKGFSGNVGILSVDIDGNDYWVWERIQVVSPVIVVIEWNSVFGPEHEVSVPYDPAFQREKAHYSNLFYGASIRALEHLGKRKGYALLGSNTAGNNLFFVRNDRLGRLKTVTANEAYVESRFRESRDTSGALNFLGGLRRRAEILDVPLIDVMRDEMTTLRAQDQLISIVSIDKVL